MMDRQPAEWVYLFPGTGVPFCGHEFNFYVRHRSVIQPFLEAASHFTDRPLIDRLQKNDPQTLNEHDFQLFTIAFSCGMFDVFRQHKIIPEIVSGYSMGTYSALYACGALDYSDCLYLASNAYRLMKQVVNSDQYGMGAVIGLTFDEVNELVIGISPLLHIVNINNDTCFIISGKKSDIAIMLNMAEKKGAIKASKLTVEIPYHHAELMKEASVGIKKYITECKWNAPAVPVLSTIDRKMLTTAQNCADLVADNLSSPINWACVIEYLLVRNRHNLIECGPGITLTQNGRFVSPELRFINVKNCLVRILV